MIRTRVKTGIGTVLLGALLAVSCGADSPPDALPFVSDDVLAGLSETDLVLVELEATWMCDALRRSSPEPGVVDQVRAAALDRDGVSEVDYRAFRASLEERIELREAVLVRFLELCG